jgi:hypothetical protein
MTTHTLIARINHRLAKTGEKLRRSNPRDVPSQGSYYTVITNINAVGRVGVDPEELGRELGVLRDGETVAIS